MVKKNTINWSNKEVSPCGNPIIIPKLLHYIFHNDDSNKYISQAHCDLENLIVCQGTLYEAAYFTIPEIINELRFGNLENRDVAYDLLTEIANGYSANDVMINYNGNQLELTKACRLKIMDDIPLFLLEISKKESTNESIENSLHLLGTLKEKKTSLIPQLEKLLTKYPEYAESVLSAIKYLNEPD